MLLATPAWSQQQKPTEPPPIAGQPAAVPQPATLTGSPPGAGDATPGAAGTVTPAAAPMPAAATPAPGAPAPATPDAFSATRLMNGPSLHETGRIALTPGPAPMSLIEGQGTLTSPNEKSIAHAASTLGNVPAAKRTGVIPAAVLDREIAEHFMDIGGCRIEVARTKQVPPTQITADRLLLRWIIEPDGTTGPTDVVAVAPVDLSIMDCAKRVMSQWKFTPPRGGSMLLERPYAF
jgi:hypothetical protein